MNRKDTMKKIAARSHVSAALAGRVFQAAMDLLTEQGIAQGRIRVNGVGTFFVREYAARMGRNPATGEAVYVAARKTIAFRPDNELKRIVNQETQDEQGE